MHNGPSGTTWSTSELPDGLCARSAPPSSGSASREDSAAAPTVGASMPEVMSAAAAGSPAAPLEGEEAGLDMADFEELLDHLKTSEYMPGDFVFRCRASSEARAASNAGWSFCVQVSYCSEARRAKTYYTYLRQFGLRRFDLIVRVCLFFLPLLSGKHFGRFLYK